MHVEDVLQPPDGGDTHDAEANPPSTTTPVDGVEAGVAAALPMVVVQPMPPALPVHTARWAYWLPSTRQLVDASRLRLGAALGPDHEGIPFVAGLHTSMRQAFGLIVLGGLVGGLSRLIWQWATFARLHTVAPLQRLDAWSAWIGSRFVHPDAWLLLNQQARGLAPRAPDWVAAGLNALGNWVSLPMQLLTVWIVYGLLMLVVAKVLGAGTTLPRVYAALGYAVLPALLLLLWPLPVIGPSAAVLAALLALVLVHYALRAATGLGGAHALISEVLPAVVILAFWGLFASIAALIAFV